MTKTIKFNLMLDKHPVRDLDDLRENFNLDDLLTTYQNKLLQRWLQVRGLSHELTQLEAIKTNDKQEIAAELCKIFQVNLSADEIRTAVYPFIFRQKKHLKLNQLAEQGFNREAVIDEYHAGYEKLCTDMSNHSEDYPFLKSAIDTLWQDYGQLFSVDFDLFFALFIEKSPLTLYSMLGSEAYRQAGLFDNERKDIVFSSVPNQLEEVTTYIDKEVEKEGPITKLQKDTNFNWEKVVDVKVVIKQVNDSSNKVKLKDKLGTEYAGKTGVGKVMTGLNFYSYSSSDFVEYALLTKQNIKEKQVKSSKPLPAYLQSYSGITDGYWKDIEPKDKKCLILKMENGNFIRNAQKNGEEINASSINGNFLILDGIDYKSNNADHTLIYMVI